MKKKKKLPVVIDADYLLYVATMSNADTGNFFKADEGDAVDGKRKKVDKKKYRERFKRLVNEMMDDIAVNFPYGVDISADPILIFSDPDGNFRYDIFPDYKKNRTGEKTKDFYKLRKWCHKKYFVAPHLEADDVVAWYARQGHLCVSIDKDLLQGVPGKWYDPKHGSWLESTEDATRPFVLMQTLAGDSTDGIPGLPRVGMATAHKLLDEFGWNWAGVVKAYESKGLAEEDAILTRRLVGMDQAYRTKKGKWKVRLWEPTK